MSDAFVRTVTVWDLPTRLFHWLLVLLVGLSFVTGEFRTMTIKIPMSLPGGGQVIPTLDIHLYSGLTVLSLLVFRIVWGVFGSESARFASFVRGPWQVFDHLRRLRAEPDFVPGHNPAGAVMIVLMLVLLTVQAVTGLVLTDDDDPYAFTAPFNGHVGEPTAKLLATIHAYNWTIIQILVIVHVIAVLYYVLARRENLIGAMFSGRRVVPPGTPTPDLTFAPTLLGLLLAAVAGVAVWAVVRFAA